MFLGRRGRGEAERGQEGARAKPLPLTIAGEASRCTRGPGCTRNRRTGRTCRGRKGAQGWERLCRPPESTPSPPTCCPRSALSSFPPRRGQRRDRTGTKSRSPTPANLYLKPFPKQLCPELWPSSERAEQGWAAGTPSSPLPERHTHVHLLQSQTTRDTNQDTHNVWSDTHTPATSLAPLLEARSSHPSSLWLLQQSWAGVGQACGPPASQTLQETGAWRRQGFVWGPPQVSGDWGCGPAGPSTGKTSQP